MPTWVWIFGVWILLNLISFGMFGIDKSAAESRSRRISEFSLIGVALLGGSIGAVIGQRVLRHKTKKEPFRSILFAVVALHAGIAAFLIVRLMRG